MIRFDYNNSSVELENGGLWTVPAAKGSYRDTAAESLWAIVNEVEKGKPWKEAVAGRYAESNPWLYNIVTSPVRSLFFRKFPPAAGSAVLDIGAGWGQMALPLAGEYGAEVTALEPTPERLAFIKVAACQEGILDRMHFVQADFLDLKFGPSYDLICCIGVLEWVPKFRHGEPRQLQLEFLKSIRSALKKGGTCCVGIENRLGLKYLMGARDDHTGQRQISVFHSELASEKHRVATGEDLRAFTYSHAEYVELFKSAGFEHVKTYAAFPDYKLPELIIECDDPSGLNQRLLTGAIPREHDGQDGSLLPHPEEYLSHYRSLAKMGIAHHFCPSFFFTIR